ncbi:MAG: di-trans,poly-cis-decaprenylcistransferase [Legionellaceae bacterium]|nr:di-trans,poly-cis-decaprenylcistransferase [Legionellaceae bacterium]
MDGNGRWAEGRGLPRVSGHQAGVEVVRQIVEVAGEQGIQVLSLFAFSTENWQRPEKEVGFLMKLLLKGLQKEIKKLHEKNIQLRVIGDRSRLSASVVEAIEKAQRLTANNTGPVLVLAINYGGQWDIVEAAREVAAAVQEGQLSVDDINAEVYARHLSLADLPPVDLFIRTSGELRISNFFLWQLAYAELYFTEVLWPDFGKAEFMKALAAYQDRKRRFGKVAIQES